MSSLSEFVKFAQLPIKPKSPDMIEKQEVLIPLIKKVFPDWTGKFINNPLLDSIEVMMRKGVYLVTVRFSNKDFLKPSQQRDDYFVSLLDAAKSKHDLNSVVKEQS